MDLSRRIFELWSGPKVPLRRFAGGSGEAAEQLPSRRSLLGLLPRAPWRASKSLPSIGPLGLDLSLERINVVQMEREGDELKVRAAASVPYGEDRDRLLSSPVRLRRAIQDVLRSRPFRGNRVVSCLPPSDVKMIHLNYEVRPGQAEGDAIVKALQERLGADLKGWIMDYVPIRGEDQQSERSALAVAAPREKVIEYLDLLGRAGLEPEFLEVGPVSIRRLVASLREEGEYPNVLVLNVARERSYATVVWGRRLVFHREIDTGEDQMLTRLADHLEITPEEARHLIRELGVYSRGGAPRKPELPNEEEIAAATITEILRPAFLRLVEEVTKALVYTASITRGGSVERVYLLGGIGRWSGADEFLNDLLRLPVKVPNPLDFFEPRSGAANPDELKPIAGLVLAAGCALRGISDGV